MITDEGTVETAALTAVETPIVSTSPASATSTEPAETIIALSSQSTTATAAPVVTTETSHESMIPAPTTAASASRPDGQLDGKIVLVEGFYSIKLDEAVRARITGVSYPADDTDIQINYDDLRYLKLLHYDFEGTIREGELIVHHTLAEEVLSVFLELFKAEYPLTSVRLVDDFGADDKASMTANNTSAFNYRVVSGTTSLSRHALGAAIDINPMLNPYVVGDYVSPPNGAEYIDRSRDFAGKIDHDDLCYQLFTARGWAWGGDWRTEKDYQHFSKKIS